MTAAEDQIQRIPAAGPGDGKYAQATGEYILQHQAEEKTGNARSTAPLRTDIARRRLERRSVSNIPPAYAEYRFED